MDRTFYQQFINSCQEDQENLANLKTLVETTLNAPIDIKITKVEEVSVLTARLLEKGKIRHAAGGFSTIPAYFDDGRLRLMPLFLYETETIDPRFLAYENSHIQQFLDNPKVFFLPEKFINALSHLGADFRDIHQGVRVRRSRGKEVGAMMNHYFGQVLPHVTDAKAVNKTV